MVGFKTVWPLLFLLAVISCVPQTKQTQCATNEAFNASLRTCVPIIGGATNHVKIDTYLPTTTLVKYVGSTTMEFSITVSNPYALTYTVEWVRSYNGFSYPLSTSIPLEMQISPSLLSIGTHVITAKIKVDGKVVDTHNFEIIITNNPTPTIVDSSVTPPNYSIQMFPPDPAQVFTFNITNNGSTDVASGSYTTEWSLYRNGVQLVGFDCDDSTNGYSDPFTVFTSSGTNIAACTFDPANPLINSLLGIYTLRARVTRGTPLAVVDEQVWSIALVHPVLSPITSRAFFDPSNAVNKPSIGDNGTLVAFNGIPYTSFTTYNFNNPSSTSAMVTTYRQAEFCVAVQSAEGTYPSDGLGVRVDWYLDGVTHLYTNDTITAGTNKLCLADGLAAVLNNVVFHNVTTTGTELHTIVARVTDERTGIEYTQSNQSGSLSSLTYPITWKISVRPPNRGPNITSSSQTAGSSSLSCTGTTTSKNCQVYSDKAFSVSMTMPTSAQSGDDFYSLPANAGNLSIECRLYEGSVLVNTVTAAYSGAGGVFTCANMSIPSYNASGPVAVHTKTYQIQAEILDTGSPLTTTPARSATTTWNFAVGKVFETNTPLTIANEAVTLAVIEGNNLTFYAEITDAERDDFTYNLQYCLNPACTTVGSLTSGTVNKHVTATPDANPYLLTITVPLPQDFLHAFTALGYDTLLRNTSGNVDFRLVVTDKPSNTTVSPIPIASNATSTLQTSAITNYNPAPVIDVSFGNPNPTTVNGNYWSFVGVPLAINNNPLSILSDASGVTTEDKNAFRYQWYARNQTSVGTWTPIPGENSYDIVWSPSLITSANLSTDNPIELILCVSDYPLSVPMAQATSTCNTATPWRLTVYNNMVQQHIMQSAPSLTDLAYTSAHLGTETAVWFENSVPLNGSASSVSARAVYTAMIGNDRRIHVKKMLVRTDGSIDTINSSLVATFAALPTGTTSAVKNISITGIAANSLYVAYMASENIAPNSYYPQVRRIDISQSKTTDARHPGKFGFDYDGMAIDLSGCSTGVSTNGADSGAVCVGAGMDNSSAAEVTTFTFSTPGSGVVVLQLPNSNTFSFSFAASSSATTICSACASSTMATDFANLINTSTDPVLAGYSATAAGSVVTISGAQNADWFDGRGLGHNADQVGKIYISGGSWYLPFIDSALGGSHNDKISFYSAPTGAVMGSPALVPADAFTTGDLASIEPALQFDNYFDGTNLYIASVAKVGGDAYLYKLNPTTLTFPTSSAVDKKEILTNEVNLSVKLAVNGTHVFVGSKVSGGEMALGIYDTSFNLESETFVQTNVASGTDTASIFNYSKMASSNGILSYSIVPYGTEARIIASSMGTSGTDYRLYMARLRKVSGTWTLSCGNCKTISQQGLFVSPFVSMGVSPVSIKTSPSLAANRLASGALGSRDVVFLGFAQMNAAVGAATSSNPYLGVLNIEAEAIGATGLHSSDSGLFSPPLIKN